jgi:hypothetical protein
MDALQSIVKYGCQTVSLADKGLQAIGQFAINSSENIGDATLILVDIPKNLNASTVKKTVGATVLLAGLTSCFHDAYYKEPVNVEKISHENKFENDSSVSPPTNNTSDLSGIVSGDTTASPNNNVFAIRENGSPSSFLTAALSQELVPISHLGEKELSNLKRIVNYEGSTPFRTAILGINSSSQWKFYHLFSEYNKLTGERINLKSAWRSPAKQKELLAMYGNVRAAGACGSPHAIGAVDVDRDGEVSRQVAKMRKLNLLNKYGLWVPPEVGEAWHIEDPDAVWFRYLKAKDPGRKDYSKYVCSGLEGTAHNEARIADGIFSIKDSFVRVSETADKVLADKNIVGNDARLLKEYLLFSVRSESFYGKTMISKTGAKGWWQFTGPVAKSYHLKYPMQLEEAARATIELALDNRRSLQVYGIIPTVENIYLSHVIGAKGVSLVDSVIDGKVLSDSEKKTVIKVVSAQLPKTLYAKMFHGKLGESTLKPGVDIKDVVAEFNGFFNGRFVEYNSDNHYLSSITGVA